MFFYQDYFLNQILFGCDGKWTSRFLNFGMNRKEELNVVFSIFF
jgi:hypothetical protein